MKRSAFWGILLVIPIVPILIGPGMFLYPRYSDFSDLTISHLPNAIFISDTIRDYGFIPLWSNLLMSGYPVSADPLSGIWYPPAWINVLLPAPLGFNLTAALHLLWAGLGMAAFLSRSGLKKPTSLFGGIAFAAMPKLFAHLALGHVSMVYALAWFPWLLLAERRRGESGAPRLIRILPGCVLGLIALADVRSLAYAALLYFLFWIWGWIAQFGGKMTIKSAAAQIGGFLGQITLGLGIAAAQLVPLLQFSALSTRADLTPEEALAFSLPLKKLLNLFVPDFGGYAEWISYPGAVVAFLCILVLATPGLRRRLSFWLVLIAAALTLALGANLPFLGWIGSLPGVNLLRAPSRLVFLAGIGAVVAASHALDALIAGYRRPKFDPVFWMVATAVFFAGLVIGSAAMGFPVGANLIWGSAGMVLATALIGLTERGTLPPAVAATAFFTLLIADLLGVNLQSVQYRSAQDVYKEGAAVVEFIGQDQGRFRVYSPSYAVPQLAAAKAGIEMASAINPLQIKAYAGWLHAASGAEQDGYSVALPPLDDADISRSNQSSRIDAEKLGEGNVRYVVAHYPIQEAALEQVWQQGELRIYINTAWRERAWLEGGEDRAGGVAIEGYAPGKVDLSADGPGRLVLSEVWYPGWRVEVDGERASILRVANAWMGVELLAGRHQIQFYYSPTWQYVGIGLSIACWAAVLFVALFRRRR